MWSDYEDGEVDESVPWWMATLGFLLLGGAIGGILYLALAYQW
jgi:hypothetical protein